MSIVARGDWFRRPSTGGSSAQRADSKSPRTHSAHLANVAKIVTAFRIRRRSWEFGEGGARAARVARVKKPRKPSSPALSACPRVEPGSAPGRRCRLKKTRTAAGPNGNRSPKLPQRSNISVTNSTGNASEGAEDFGFRDNRGDNRLLVTWRCCLYSGLLAR